MNNAESITVSLEWAKKLKEAGWPQNDSALAWTTTKAARNDGRPSTWQIAFQTTDGLTRRFRTVGKKSERIILAAPTAEEILRKIPTLIEHDKKMYAKKLFESTDQRAWHCYFETTQIRINEGWLPFYGMIDWNPKPQNTLANAAAAMWCYLKKNNLLPSE